MQKARNFIQPL